MALSDMAYGLQNVRFVLLATKAHCSEKYVCRLWKFGLGRSNWLAALPKPCVYTARPHRGRAVLRARGAHHGRP